MPGGLSGRWSEAPRETGLTFPAARPIVRPHGHTIRKAQRNPTGRLPPARVPAGEPVPVIKGSHVYLIDGSGYIFRAFHALPPLTRPSDGLPVGAVHGFCAMLWKLLQDSAQVERADAPRRHLRLPARRRSATRSTRTTRRTGRRRPRSWSRSSR